MQVMAVDVTQFFNASVPPAPLGLVNSTAPLTIPSGGWMGACVAGVCPVPFRYFVLAPLLGPYVLVGQVCGVHREAT